MQAMRLYVSVGLTLLLLGLGYSAVFFGSGAHIHSGIGYCGGFGLLAWMEWSVYVVQNPTKKAIQHEQ